ncbi:MAG: tetratricopeptide repeat protein [Planctomycetota bacterium]
MQTDYGWYPRRWYWMLTLLALAASSAGMTDAERPHLAVIDFQVTPGTAARDVWVATAVEETLAWRLRRVPDLLVVPTVRMHQARRELHDEDTPMPAWPRVALALGADYIISGRCSGYADEANLELKLIRLRAEGATPRVFNTPSGSLFEVLDSATHWVLRELKIGPPPDEVRQLIFAQPCRTSSSLEYYARAIAAVRAGDAQEARHYVLRSLDYDGRYRPALAMLAQLEIQSGMRGGLVAEGRLRLLDKLARTNNDWHDQAVAQLGQGAILQMTGLFDTAYTRYETALAISYAQGSPYGQLAALNNICDLYLTQRIARQAKPSAEQAERYIDASLKRATEWQEIALRMLEEMGDQVAEAAAVNKLALIYERRGEWDKALALHKRTLAVAERLDSRRNQASAWLYIGQCHRRATHWPEAVESFQRCLSLAPKEAQPIAHMALAATYRTMEAPADALREYEVVYEHILAGDDLASQLLCAREIAALRMQLGQREAALSALQEAIDVAHALRLPEEAELREQLAEWRERNR